MKNITFKHTLFLATFLFAAFTAFSQSTKPVTVEFWVAGTCKDCKNRIETAMDVKGVLFCEYDVKEHMLEVTYKPHKITEDDLHKLVAAAGHDTKKVIAPDDAYNKVDECCRYRTHDCSKH